MSLSFFGEDSWIRSCFPACFKGWALDVGAFDGVTGSNTLALEQQGWQVLCVEANPYAARILGKHRSSVDEVGRKMVWNGAAADRTGRERFWINLGNPNAYSALNPVVNRSDWRPGNSELDWRIVDVDVDTLDNVLAGFKIPQLHAVSIDIEGGEMDALKGFDIARWRPKCMVVESWDEDNPVVPYLARFGYERTKRLLVSDCFLLREGAVPG